jgi:hypothetical protein
MVPTHSQFSTLIFARIQEEIGYYTHLDAVQSGAPRVDSQGKK